MPLPVSRLGHFIDRGTTGTLQQRNQRCLFGLPSLLVLCGRNFLVVFSILLTGGFVALYIFLTIFGFCHDWSPSVMERHYCRSMDTNALFAQEVQSFPVKSGAKNV